MYKIQLKYKQSRNVFKTTLNIEFLVTANFFLMLQKTKHSNVDKNNNQGKTKPERIFQGLLQIDIITEK